MRSARRALSAVAALAATVATVAVVLTRPVTAAPESTPTTAPPGSSTAGTAPPAEPGTVALYPSLDEFVGRWNDANALINQVTEGGARIPIDPAAVVVRPIGDGFGFFDWHVPGVGYLGALVDDDGDVHVAVVAGAPEGIFMRSAAATLLFLLTADSADDSAALSNAYLAFAADPQPGDVEYVVAGPGAAALFAFDGIEAGSPWVGLAIAPVADADRAIADAVALSRLVAASAEPPAPAPAAQAPAASAAPSVPASVEPPASPPAPASGLRREAEATATTTTTTTTIAATTTTVAGPATTSGAAAPAVTAAFPTLDSFVSAWNETVAAMTSVDPTADVFVIDPAAILRQPLPDSEVISGADVFAVPIRTNGFVGGLVDRASGEVTGVLVGGDPDSEVVRSSAGTLLLASLDPSVAGPAVEAWAALADDTGTVQVDIVEAGPLAVTLEVVAGAEEGDNLVSVFVAPRPASPQSIAIPILAFNQVFGLALSAPPPPSTVPGPTTSIAALPATAPAGPTTTALPTIGLIPTVTTVPP